MYRCSTKLLGTFYKSTMGFFDDIGREFDVFFNRTIPSIGREVGNFTTNLFEDSSRSIGKSVNNLVSPTVQTLTQTSEKVIKAAGSEIKNVLPVASESIRTVTQGVGNALGNIQLPLAVGGIALVVLLLRR